MAITPIGTNTVTAISRRLILPEIADNVYKSNPFFFRANAAHRKSVQGGTQIEQPLMYTNMTSYGWYSGFDQLNTAPSDTVQNAVFMWKQAYVNVSVDGLTMIRVSSPLAIANFIATQFAQAQMQMADLLGQGMWSDSVTNVKAIDGILGAIDNGTINASYGGIARGSNAWWNAQIDSTTTVMTLAALQALYGSTTVGGQHPTIIASNQHQYNNYWALNTSFMQYPRQPVGSDENLAQAGFQNLLFNNTPWFVDSHVPTTGTQGFVFFINENFLEFVVASMVDFYLEDFQTPVDQDAMVSKLLWAGDLTFSNVQLSGKFTALT